MMRIHSHFMRTTRRVPVNLIAADKARLVERHLTDILRGEAADPFAEENSEAVAANSGRVAEFGVFSDEHRSF